MAREKNIRVKGLPNMTVATLDGGLLMGYAGGVIVQAASLHELKQKYTQAAKAHIEALRMTDHGREDDVFGRYV